MIPYTYQLECVDEIVNFKGRALCVLDPGLGKTAIALLYLERRQAVPCVVVCPSSVKFQWRREAKRVTSLRKIFICEGRAAGTTSKHLRKYEIIIVNYDILKDWQPVLKEVGPRLVIIDETQRIADARAKCTQACQLLCQGVKRIIGLSGTPVLNKTFELYSILQIVRPDIFKSRWEFAYRYCKPEKTPWGMQFKGATHLDELHEILEENLMIRRKKADVLPDLPSKIRNVITLPIEDTWEYERASRNFIRWLTERDPARAKRAMRAEAMVKVGYLLQLAARLKIPSGVQWINELLDESDEKLVVFATHKEVISSLRESIKADTITIDGSVSGPKRKKVVNAFASRRGPRVLLGNIRAAGVGLDGLQVASNVVFFELPWQPGAVVQAEDRIYRIGTENTAWVWYLVAQDTIETKLCKLLQKKQEILDMILDGEKAKDFDVFNTLMKNIR